MVNKPLQLIINAAWVAAYSVGVTAIDSDHRRLYQMLRRMREAYAAEENARCLALIRDAAAAILAHFAHEEALFAGGRYPGAEGHVAKHAILAQRVQAISRAAQGPSVARCALADLIDGLAVVVMTDHITLDLELRPFPA
jgi:hemerythrin-like metal-binding protein